MLCPRFGSIGKTDVAARFAALAGNRKGRRQLISCKKIAALRRKPFFCAAADTDFILLQHAHMKKMKSSRQFK